MPFDRKCTNFKYVQTLALLILYLCVLWDLHCSYVGINKVLFSNVLLLHFMCCKTVYIFICELYIVLIIRICKVTLAVKKIL